METRIKTVFFFLAAGLLVFLTMPVWATENDCRQGHRQCGHDDGNTINADADARSESDASSSADSDASSNATSSSNSSGGAGGDGGAGGAGGAGGSASGGAATSNSGSSNEISNSSKSNSVYLGAARDTAGCFTKVQLGAEGFGIGFSRSDAYCKKVRRISDHVSWGNYRAATRLECTLKEWRGVYGKDVKQCWRDLFMGDGEFFPEENPVIEAAVIVEEHDYDHERVDYLEMQIAELTDQYQRDMAAPPKVVERTVVEQRPFLTDIQRTKLEKVLEE